MIKGMTDNESNIEKKPRRRKRDISDKITDQGPVHKKSKTISSKRFQYQWFDDYPLWRTWVREVPNDCSKFFCKACKSILTCGLSEIKKHALRENHIKNLEKLNLNYCIDNPRFINSTSLINADNSGQPEMIKCMSNLEDHFNFNDRVKVAEIKLATFFVEKNVPFSLSSDLLSIMKNIGKEPGLLRAMSLSRKKLTQIITKVVCRTETDRISKVLREDKFSIYKAETSDVMNNKWFPLMVRYVDPITLDIRCELLQMIYLRANDCSESKMFEAFENEMLKNNISLQLIVGLACDNASIIIDNSSSIETKLSETNPCLVTLPCVCHSSALAAKVACKIIPQDCERFIKGISAFVNGSSKRSAIFRDFNMCLENSSLTTLKYADTCWLTRHKCIQRILEKWDTLGQFLMGQSFENIHSADNLLEIFQNPATKAYFFFLKFTLDAFNKYNAKFQAQESLIHELQPSSMELLLWFLRKFIKPDLLKSEILDSIENLKFSDRDNQLLLEEIDFGSECEKYLKEQLDKQICCEMDIISIRKNCLQFYVMASKQIRKRLPINDKFLECVTVFESKSVLFDRDRHSTFRKVLHVNNRLGELVDEKLLEIEWESLYGIESDTKEEWSNLSFDDMWIQIGLFSTEEGQLYFPGLRSLLSAVRTLPHSNAITKRIFSLIPDVKSKRKNNRSFETLNATCVIRYALKDSNNTACTMKVTREHLNLMSAENLYEQKKSKQKSNLILREQNLDDSDP